MPSIDRLSSLPDDVLCHILSFLPTKFSMKTIILGKRWRFLWAHVPTLDFDGETSSPHNISWVLSLHKVQNLHTFRLCYEDNEINDYDLRTWMTTVISRNLKYLDLCLDYVFMFSLPLYTFQSLVNLKLDCYVDIAGTSVVCLPCLKKLHLCCEYYIADEEDLPLLLSACPVLEELIMERFVEDGLYCCNICSLTLKMLIVDFPFDNDLGSEYDEHRLEINAPALIYLYLRDCVSKSISAQRLTSLIHADICLDYYFEVEKNDYYFVEVLNFVDSLCNVKSLKLSSRKTFPVGLFADQRDSFIRFDNLVKLELAADWIFLKKLLKVADNLEVLVIHEVEDRLKNWIEPKQVPMCLFLHLRTIRIERVGYTEQEFEMVGYFLRNAEVLERVIIYSRNGISSSTKSDAKSRISLVELGSEACELALY